MPPLKIAAIVPNVTGWKTSRVDGTEQTKNKKAVTESRPSGVEIIIVVSLIIIVAILISPISPTYVACAIFR